MSNWRTFSCMDCGETTSINPCAQCRQTKQLQMQTELMERSARESQQRAERDNYMAQQAQARAEQARQQELAEIERNNRIMERIQTESNTSEATARAAGYSWDWIRKQENSLALEGSIDEDGYIDVLRYKKPYLSESLNAAFSEGVWQRLRKEVSKDLRIDIKAMQKAVAEQGRAGRDHVTFEYAPKFLGSKAFTFSHYEEMGKSRVEPATGRLLYNRRCARRFSNNSLNSVYLKAFDEWEEQFLRDENTDEKIQARLSEEETKKSLETVKHYAYVVAFFVLLCMLLPVPVGKIVSDLASGLGSLIVWWIVIVAVICGGLLLVPDPKKK